MIRPAVFAALIALFCMLGCKKTISFQFDPRVDVAKGDIGDILLAMDKIDVEDVNIELNPGKFKTVVGGKKVTLALGKNLKLKSKRVAIHRVDASEPSTGNINSVEFDIGHADLEFDGSLSVTYGKLPPVSITRLDVTLDSSSADQKGDGTAQVDFAVRKIVAALFTHIVAGPARTFSGDELSVDRIVRKGTIGHISASLKDGSKLSLANSIVGALGSNNHLSLKQTSFSMRDEQPTAKSEVDIQLNFAKSISLKFDQSSAVAESLGLSLAGKITTDGRAAQFVLKEQPEASITLSNAQITMKPGSAKQLLLKSPSLTASFSSLNYNRDNSESQGVVDASAISSGEVSCEFSETTKNAKHLISVDSLKFKELVLNSDSTQSTQTIESKTPVVLSGIKIVHSTSDSSATVSVPQFAMTGLASRSPSDLQLDISNLMATANKLEVRQGKNQLLANFGKDFKVTLADGKFDLSDQITKGIGTISAKGKVDEFAVTANKKTLKADKANIDLTVACSDSIEVSGGATGFLSVSSGDLAIPNAKVRVSSSSLTFDSKGNIKRGKVVIAASIPAGSFAKLVSDEIPAQFQLPKEDIRIKTVGGTTKELFEKVLDADTTVKSSFENGRVRTNIKEVSFKGDRFFIKGEPSVSGKIAGKLGFDVAASFDLKADAKVAFTKPESLKELRVVAKPTYRTVDIKLNSGIKNVPGANELKNLLVSSLTGGQGLKKYLPREFKHHLFTSKVIQKNPQLQRLVNPRINLTEKGGTVELTISAAVN